MNSTVNPTSEPDILGEPYEARTLTFPDDHEGEVVATLVRRPAPEPTKKAVLYVHGFIDYFFQTHLADFYTAAGFDFYALDLRKYGRSLRPHQTANYCAGITEYFPELDAAAQIIKAGDGHDTLLLNGHSTGGLLAALWAHTVRGKGVVDAVFLNSPFFDFNQPAAIRRALSGAVNAVGRFTPLAKLPVGLPTVYGPSIHADHHGEWSFDIAWKPLLGLPIRAGWARAMRSAHRRLQAGLAIDVPVLVACSTASFVGRNWTEDAQRTDAILNVRDIVRWTPGLGRHVTLVRVDGGVHDLVLSAKPVREQLFTDLGRWLATYA